MYPDTVNVGVEIVEAEALRVGPDEVLVIKLGSEHAEHVDHFMEALESVGLGGRALVIYADDAELSVVPRGTTAARPLYPPTDPSNHTA